MDWLYFWWRNNILRTNTQHSTRIHSNSCFVDYLKHQVQPKIKWSILNQVVGAFNNPHKLFTFSPQKTPLSCTTLSYSQLNILMIHYINKCLGKERVLNLKYNIIIVHGLIKGTKTEEGLPENWQVRECRQECCLARNSPRNFTSWN